MFVGLTEPQILHIESLHQRHMALADEVRHFGNKIDCLSGPEAKRITDLYWAAQQLLNRITWTDLRDAYRANPGAWPVEPAGTVTGDPADGVPTV